MNIFALTAGHNIHGMPIILGYNYWLVSKNDLC
jgi:hypothetical protein